jgi:hypothetical protein
VRKRHNQSLLLANKMVARQTQSTSTQRPLISQHRVVPKYLSSAQDTNLHWFPSSLSAHDAFAAAARRQSHSTPTAATPIVTATDTSPQKAAPVDDPWLNGTRLSELLATILTDKSLSKQVETFDQFGRLLKPPKLLLVGSVLFVRSRAQVRLAHSL